MNQTNLDEALEGFQVTSRAEKTKEDYMFRALQLLNRAKKQLEIPDYEYLVVDRFIERIKTLLGPNLIEYKIKEIKS